MSAVLVLKTARAAGLTFHIEGEHLVVEARSAPPPEVIEAVSLHKAEIVNLLRRNAAGWSPEDWHALFDERAAVLEYDGGLGRLDAELWAFEDCVDHWLATHPPVANGDGCCLCCGTPISSMEQSIVMVPCAQAHTRRLHVGCAPRWKNVRRWDARTALRWLLKTTDDHDRCQRPAR